MIQWDRPLYLHFLDRELGESVNYRLNSQVGESILKCLAIGSTAYFYCGLSSIWESPGMDDELQALFCKMVAAGLINAVSAHPTLDEFLESRQALYAHDAARYPMYFKRTGLLRGGVPPTELKLSSATKTLASKLGERVLSGAVTTAFRSELSRTVKESLAMALARREEEAITFSLFRPHLKELDTNTNVAGVVRREISTHYTNHYMEFGQADIPTGITGLQYFDGMAREFPLFDVALLAAVLTETGFEEVLSQSWRKCEEFWSAIETWRNQGAHLLYREKLRLFLQALVEADRNRFKELSIAEGFSGLRMRVRAAVKSAAGASTRKRKASPWRAFPENALLAISELIELSRRERTFALALDSVLTRYPEKRCDVLLVTTTPIERDAVLSEARALRTSPRPLFGARRSYFDIGHVSGARVLLVESEAGSTVPGGSLSTISQAIDDVSPSSVVMVGIAFGVNPRKQKIADVLVSRQVQCYEPQRISATRRGKFAIVPRGDCVTASTKLLNRFRASTANLSSVRVSFGLVLSGEKLIDDLKFRQIVVGQKPEAIGGEMEGAGLYVAAQERHVDWILVKAICDWADGKKRIQKAKRQEAAARAAATFVFQTLAAGGFGASLGQDGIIFRQ